MDNINNKVTKEDIIEAIKYCIKITPLINSTETLINSIYNILTTFYIDEKDFVILEAPTGSGKTIIGFMTYFCSQYINNKKLGLVPDSSLTSHAYFLTSSKLLQEQIDNDLDKFNFREYISILKGTANYYCINGIDVNNIKDIKKLSKEEKEKLTLYSDRQCKGLSGTELELQYNSCFDICPYKIARTEASEKSCAVLNYAYFLNVLKSEGIFFNTRHLTIADEAHLIPNIICNIFNFEFNQFKLNQINKLLYELEVNFGTNALIELSKELISNIVGIFHKPLTNINVFGKYFDTLDELRINLLSISKDSRYDVYINQININVERLSEETNNSHKYWDLLKRPNDIYFESEKISNYSNSTSVTFYKHIVKDLSESKMVQDNFLSKVEKCLLMSATLGNIDEYVDMMGIDINNYKAFKIPSNFNFTKSPIYLCNSGALNYTNFNSNIDAVLMDLAKICNTLHPKEKGIIHTGTFKINELLKTKINMGIFINPERFLFYSNSDEKEVCIQKLKNSTKPYIIVGPSLYEGLDLPDDHGRFNICIKVPYELLSPYMNKKIERYPYYYERCTIEKIEQLIGRTNRSVNDYSTCYLLDSMFNKMIMKTNQTIINRVKNLKL